ncbi:MAG: squalene/phytoene synthase family protein [Gammaproteobacteria bacterium]
MNNTYPYFEEKTAPTGSTLYYSILFSSPEIRAAMTALHAFYQELDRICSGDPHIAHQRLAWWHDEIIRLAENTPRHPITQTLQSQIQKFSIPIETLHNLIDHPDFAHLTKLTALYIPGGNVEKLAPYANELSQAFQLVDNIIHVRKILSPGEKSPTIGEFIQQTEQAKKHYQSAMDILPAELRKTQLHQIIFAELQFKLLTEIQKSGFNVLTHKTSLTPLHKLWTAWKIKRSER